MAETAQRIEWRPNPGPQMRFLSLPCYEALYGGAAGGGKSEALLINALRHVDKPSYRALMLRRTFVELNRSLIDRSQLWYPAAGGRWSGQEKKWRFPSGASIEFGHVEHAKDVHGYQSSEYQYIGFDELTTFEESQYVYLLSRARSAHGIPIRIRAATNPGGIGHDWVMRRWAPWLETSGRYGGPRAESGQVLHYRNAPEGEQWCERGPGAFGRVFVQALVQDNPKLMESDPGYVDRLRGLDSQTRRHLLEGDWSLYEDPGALWKRDTLRLGRVTHLPEMKRIVVAVDPSGSAKRTADIAGIVVCGVADCTCLGRVEKHLFVLRDLSGRFSPRDMAERAVKAYRDFDADRIIAEDNFGGQIIEDLIRLVDSQVSYRAVHASRGKIVRAEPVAALYEQGKAHHCGSLLELEDELCTYNPLTSTESPGRLDALVWGATDLLVQSYAGSFGSYEPLNSRRI